MSTAQTINQISGISPRLKARIAGFFYLLTIVVGAITLALDERMRFTADLIATAFYLAMTAIFYELFKPVSKRLALLTTSFNVVGLAIGKFNLVPRAEHVEFVFFGLFCLSIGYLIFKSTFLPRVLGALMAVAGLGYLTFLSPQLASYLSPYNLVAGVIGETSLTLWLLVAGVNEQRWKQQADAAGDRRSAAEKKAA